MYFPICHELSSGSLELYKRGHIWGNTSSRISGCTPYDAYKHPTYKDNVISVQTLTGPAKKSNNSLQADSKDSRSSAYDHS